MNSSSPIYTDAYRIVPNKGMSYVIVKDTAEDTKLAEAIKDASQRQLPPTQYIPVGVS